MAVIIQPIEAIKSMSATCIKINSARLNRLIFSCLIGVSLGLDVELKAYPTKTKMNAAIKNIMTSQTVTLSARFIIWLFIQVVN